MGLEIGLNIGKKIVTVWTKTGVGDSMLAMKPIAVDIKGLRYCGNLNSDTVNLSKAIDRWKGPAKKFVPDCNIPNSCIPRHGKVDTYNYFIREIRGTDDFDKMGAIYRAILVDKEFAQVAPLEKDCIAYRGIGTFKYRGGRIVPPAKIIQDAKVGDIIKPDEGCAYAFQLEGDLSRPLSGVPHTGENAIVQIIRIPKGAKVSRGTHCHGDEFLMPRGAEYRVVSKEIGYLGETRVVLEYIPLKTKFPQDIAEFKEFAQRHANSDDKYIREMAQKALRELEDLDKLTPLRR